MTRKTHVAAALAALIALAGCGSAPTHAKTAPAAAKPTPVDPIAALIQERYGDCLTKLHAKLGIATPTLYTYVGSGDSNLMIAVSKVNGRTFTAPYDATDVALLATVGC